MSGSSGSMGGPGTAISGAKIKHKNYKPDKAGKKKLGQAVRGWISRSKEK